MPYPEFFVAPMRGELNQLGIEELRSAADVDAAVSGTPGVLMVVVNSVCGCAAGKARPGLALALGHGKRPDRMTSVFAGFDVEATERARSYFRGVMPSSPSIALLKDGQLIYMLERHDIEVRNAAQIAGELRNAFDQLCSKDGEAQNAAITPTPSHDDASHLLKIQKH
jgi:putative YphP/YqiW family bacilliredoxin